MGGESGVPPLGELYETARPVEPIDMLIAEPMYSFNRETNERRYMVYLYETTVPRYLVARAYWVLTNGICRAAGRVLGRRLWRWLDYYPLGHRIVSTHWSSRDPETGEVVEHTGRSVWRMPRSAEWDCRAYEIQQKMYGQYVLRMDTPKEFGESYFPPR